jgi:hypothetical protein
MGHEACSFLNDEAGAVTVDWVVLTAALVGLGLAVSGVVGGGLQETSNSINSALMRDNIILTSFARVTAPFSTGFDDGADGWTGGRMVTLAGFGEVYQIGPRGEAELSLAVPRGASRATIAFDLIGADDLSGESATITINGQTVAVYTDDHGRITRTESDIPGITVSVAQLYDNRAVGSGNHGHDSRATYTITIDNPGTDLRLGVASSSGQPISEEFFALDDVSVDAE